MSQTETKTTTEATTVEYDESFAYDDELRHGNDSGPEPDDDRAADATIVQAIVGLPMYLDEEGRRDRRRPSPRERLR